MNQIDQERYGKLLDSIVVPLLDEAIMEGRRKAQNERRAQRVKRMKRGFIAASAVIVLFASLLVGTRWSPALASTLSQIPFVSELVELVAGNKGMQDIVEHQYYEVIDKTITANNLSVTVKGAIADEYGLVLYYRVSSPESLEGISVPELNVTHNGQEIEGGISSSFLVREGEKSVDDQILINVMEPFDYSSKQFALEMKFTDEHQTAITIPFELQQPIAPTKRYPLQEKVLVSGQRIWLEELSISPLRAQLTLKIDEQNSWQLLQIDSAELIDEHGEQWGTINNGMTGWGTLRDGEAGLYFQSNYFRNPEQLTLRLGQFQALPKGEDYIEIDFAQQKVLYQPEQIDLQLTVLPKSVLYTATENVKQFNRQLFSTGIDAAGKEVFSSGGSYTSSDTEARHNIWYDLEGVVNPVRFAISAYPHMLPDTVELEIPLSP